jgi:glycosyltransferase involved in cell wall biosynthesis
MAVVINAQECVSRWRRGINHFSKMMINTMLQRAAFDYKLLFFDYHRERLNRCTINQLFGKYNLPTIEVNDIDYRILHCADASLKLNETLTYFTHFSPFPSEIDTKAVITLHDLNHLTYAEEVEGTWAKKTLYELDACLDKVKKIKPFIMTDSLSSKSEILKFTDIPEENVEVVYISCDESTLYPDKDRSGFEKFEIEGDYILYLSVIEAKKNIYRILDAFAAVAEKNKDIKLVLAGECFHPRVYNAIETHKYRDRIIKTGYVDEDMKRKLYSNALFLAYPSICEGFGMPVLEAMRCGCPVLASTSTSLPEVAGDAGILVNPRDLDEIVDAYERLISSESLRNELKLKGLIQADKFSWDKTAAQAESVFKKVMEM